LLIQSGNCPPWDSIGFLQIWSDSSHSHHRTLWSFYKDLSKFILLDLNIWVLHDKKTVALHNRKEFFLFSWWHCIFLIACHKCILLFLWFIKEALDRINDMSVYWRRKKVNISKNKCRDLKSVWRKTTLWIYSFYFPLHFMIILIFHDKNYCWNW
jgi:hypothetical protein